MTKKIKKKKTIIHLIPLILVITNLEIVNATSIEKVEIDTTSIISLCILFLLGIILFLFVSKILNSKKDLNNSIMDYSNGLTNQELEKIDKDLNIDLLKEQTFNLYKKLETAKTKQNIKNLKELITEELLLEQEQKIKALKEQSQKAVATNIKLEDFKVLSIQKNKDITNILTYLHVSQYDYIINKKKEVIRGTNDTEYQIEYKITLEQTSDNQFKIKKRECIGKWIKN